MGKYFIINDILFFFIWINIKFLLRYRMGKCEMLKNIKMIWMRRIWDDVNDRDLFYIDMNVRIVNKVGRGMEVILY